MAYRQAELKPQAGDDDLVILDEGGHHPEQSAGQTATRTKQAGDDDEVLACPAAVSGNEPKLHDSSELDVHISALHLGQQQSSEDVRCALCGNTFATQALLHLHEDACTLSCYGCRKNFANKAALDSHVCSDKSRVVPGKHTCDACGDTFTSTADMDSHTCPNKHTCDECSKTVSSQFDAEEHDMECESHQGKIMQEKVETGTREKGETGNQELLKDLHAELRTVEEVLAAERQDVQKLEVERKELQKEGNLLQEEVNATRQEYQEKLEVQEQGLQELLALERQNVREHAVLKAIQEDLAASRQNEQKLQEKLDAKMQELQEKLDAQRRE